MRLGASVTFMFREQPILQRFAAARAAGFAGVDIQDPGEAPATALARAAAEAGVTVVLLNVDMGDFFAGGPGLSGVPGRQDAFRAAVAAALEAADRMGGPLLHLGPSRIPDGVARDRCLATYEENLAWALEAAGGRTRLVVETLNAADEPAILLGDLDAVAELVRRHRPAADPAALALQFDLYHSARSGLDILAAARRHRDLIAHIQFADAPGRHEPGSGTVDFDRLMPALAAEMAAVGYDGWCAAEYRPAAATTAGLGWMRDGWVARAGWAGLKQTET